MTRDHCQVFTAAAGRGERHREKVRDKSQGGGEKGWREGDGDGGIEKQEEGQKEKEQRDSESQKNRTENQEANKAQTKNKNHTEGFLNLHPLS